MRRLMYTCGDMKDCDALALAMRMDALCRRLHSETDVGEIQGIVDELESCSVVVNTRELRRAKELLCAESELQNANDMDVDALGKLLESVEGWLTGGHYSLSLLLWFVVVACVRVCVCVWL